MTFSYAAVYQVDAVCRTPLRAGGTDGDTEQVLRRRDGTAFIQGTSLAGAMRSWLEQQEPPECALADSLFGCPDQAGHLTVSDALFDRQSDSFTRPRLHIDPVSATGKDGGKFDVAHMGAGSKLQFTLVWQGNWEQKHELDTVKKLLGAIHAGEICLGAQKTNGFGRLALTVRHRQFHLKHEADRRAWLANDWKGEILALPAAASSGRVKFTVTGRAGSILVKTAPVVDGGGRAKTYTPSLSEKGKAVLPGSSVKGAVRARVEYIAKVLGIDPNRTERYFGREGRGEDNGLPGLVRFEDGVLSGHKRKISRIRIDRFTGGVQRQGLFTEEPISCAVTLTVTAPEEPVLCALLVYALRDLGLGLYHLGSGWAVGRGRIEVEQVHIAAPGGRRAALRFDGPEGITLEDSEHLLKEWLNTLEEVRHV